MRAGNARISGPVTQEVARRFALEFGLTGFQASSDWHEKFKLRHKISQKILCGESNEVPVEILEDFIAKFRYFASGFKEENIFNADECGLFFKAMPDRSLALKGDKCKSGKLSKERFTVLLCASATGEKLKPLMIGRSAKPRAFRNLRPDDLPVTWRSNKCAWMTAAIFEEWVRSLDGQMKRMKRSIFLVVDNCLSHPRVRRLTNVTLKFLPPNTSSKTQPLDQGVIKTFKATYRTQLLQWVISKAEVTSSSVGATSIAASINALDAVLWISSSWNKVQPDAIRKRFRRAGLVRDQQDDVKL
ncbi:hypothetical protein M514_23806 [Trichuris suis]|uniref:HTH CENPB-type domain-containing protein n=1 Tax=Trichuris suis TaxID=68888 RepID=A0A085N3Q0_9BILA|nr:hypothetical protein M514_23806 [Trichuris suis]